MHSFEMTSEQFDLKLPHSNHKPIQLSNEWRQVGYMKLSSFHKLYCHWDFSDINMEPWSTFDTQLVLGWILGILQQLMACPFHTWASSTGHLGSCSERVHGSIPSLQSALVSVLTSSKYGLVIPHYYPFHFECLSQLGLSL